MAIGDKVKIGMGSIQISPENVPAYDLQSDGQGKIFFDQNGAATPKIKGGVKGGSVGVIDGNPVKVMKALLVGGNLSAAMGVEYVMLFPIKLEYYQTVAWFPQDHVHISGDYFRS